MTDELDVLYRAGVGADSAQVAVLHAESWRRHYRGAYSDAYLDGDVVADRLEVWAGRMGEPREDRFTIVAEADARLVGFVHVVLDADSLWGALVDNLHVAFGLKRQRIGATLLREAARVIVERRAFSGMHLWVQEQNVAAQRFYEAMGGQRVERDYVAAPGGDATRLNGNPTKLRYAWSDQALTGFQ
jgi:ribosomal protein S18 acetylase RimI-like enzyme